MFWRKPKPLVIPPGLYPAVYLDRGGKPGYQPRIQAQLLEDHKELRLYVFSRGLRWWTQDTAEFWQTNPQRVLLKSEREAVELAQRHLDKITEINRQARIRITDEAANGPLWREVPDV